MPMSRVDVASSNEKGRKPERQTKEYIAYLDGSRIDSNGYKSGQQVVTANTKEMATNLARKAKKYYGGKKITIKGG
jgi:hypothetical protein